ncbi:predicted protein [Naegleria gruberi]|uniref:Vesicle-fusing ATPase n=1 Tax=Naegleria gruberi TaxID=5762 RepID=D2VSI0_NAEGR|nr:uncharacterized protein NAEGRDRAFT_59102 [Naegleria gruberi]EFC40197.1 predicted protein [Naegleria gruberi]|eukprot:XP_002672941.1 predicted protein [Naegleria gruberi strain NEG-M]
MKFTIASTPVKHLQFSNLAYLHPDDIGHQSYLICGNLVTRVSTYPTIQKGEIGLNKFMRSQAGVELGEKHEFKVFDDLSVINCEEERHVVFEIKFVDERIVDRKVVDIVEMISIVKKAFNAHILTYGQSILFVMNGEFVQAKAVCTSKQRVKIDDLTTIYFKLSSGKNIMKFSNVPYDINALPTQLNDDIRIGNLNLSEEEMKEEQPDLFNADFTFNTLGIGGLEKQLNVLFRRAFASRAYPPEVAEKMGAMHTKGVLLYGPPGTGKTLIAKKIGQVLNCKTKEVVNGPEIFDSFVGGSEKKIRQLFAEAIQDWKDSNGKTQCLHLIIMDEIDAICKKRGNAGDNTGVRDNVVNQLLSMIDGVDTPNNFLIIGMTNRLDLIDPALLRKGRFDVQIEIGLPNEEGRMQILKIHTQKLQENKFLSSDVDFASIVERTKNYTGSDIMGLVASARSFAMSRGIDVKNQKVETKNIKEFSELLKVTMEDFNRALLESKPSFSVDEDDLKSFVGKGIITHGLEFEKLKEKCSLIMKQIDKGENTFLSSVLLTGSRKSGLTALAASLALETKFPFVKVVSPSKMIKMISEYEQCQYISDAFQDSYRSDKSVIILDNVERLIQLVRIGPRFSNLVLQTLMTCIRTPPPKGRKLLIIGTSSMSSSLQDLDLVEQFDRVLRVPNVKGVDNIKDVIESIAGEPIFTSKQDLDLFMDAICDQYGESVPIKVLVSVTDVLVANKGSKMEDIIELFDLKSAN